MKTSLPNLFTTSVADQVVGRINHLSAQSQPLWGKMSVGQMLAHLCVMYDMVYTDKYPKPNFVFRFFLKVVAKNLVVSTRPYPRNSRTAPIFLITDSRDFESEKKNLTDLIHKTRELGTSYFEGKESPSFGVLSVDEWNNLFYKHIDHHLTQFGV